MYYLIGQIIGYIAVGVGVLAFIQKDDKKCLYINIGVCFLWAFHYILIGLPAASYILFFDGVKSYLAPGKFRHIPLLLVFLLGNACIGIYTYNGSFTSLLPVTTSTLWTIGIFLTEGIVLRTIFFCVVCIWLFYNIFEFSLPAIISNGITLCSVVIGLVRVYFLKPVNDTK